ncbi:MAG: HDIG domain-containing protein [Chloroflexi bacterium]|nr:HDIG domain-containing protein [Chloroflexota bacterium]
MRASKAHTSTSAFQAFVLALAIGVALTVVLIPVLPGETPLDVGDVAFTTFEANGETIVREGEIVTQTGLSQITGAGLLDNDIGFGEIFSGLLVAVLAGAFTGLYLYLFQPPEVNTNRRLVMYGLLIVLWVAGAKVFFSQALPDSDRLYLSYMLPIAAAPMLIAALLDAGLALFTAALLAVVAAFAGFYMPDARQALSTGPMESLQMVTTLMLTGFVGVFAVRNAERMNNYASAGAGVGLMTIVSLFTFWLLLPNKDGIDLVWILGAGLVAGVGSVVITMGGAYVLGTVFGVATRVQLMELAQLSHPLLRELQEKAPGTFHHSVIVGNLAERAADLTGADALLVRVGCYFHDIGKIAKPGYYIENQMGGENPHDRLDPAASAKMVVEHVRAGLRITGKHRIPSKVRAFIPEHHGTRLVTYFYRKAALEDPNADAEKFRYPGPKPQTKETAIVMLADSVEAVVRSSKDRSHERIDELVDGVIRERFNEGQLDESDMTMRDLKVIAESFKATLRGIYHERIEYPEPTAGEMQAAGSAASVAFMKPPVDPMEMPPA